MILLVAANFFAYTAAEPHPLLDSGILLAAIVSVLRKLFFNGARSGESARAEAAATAAAEPV